MARTKYLKVKHHSKVVEFANFSATGSIAGMKKMYYGKDALLVRCGSFIYNCTGAKGDKIYHLLAN